MDLLLSEYSGLSIISWPFTCSNFQKKHKLVSIIHFILPHWRDTGSWNPSSRKKHDLPISRRLLMVWWHNELGHQQPWLWPNHIAITRSPHAKGQIVLATTWYILIALWFPQGIGLSLISMLMAWRQDIYNNHADHRLRVIRSAPIRNALT